jgi:hypothetical protein
MLEELKLRIDTVNAHRSVDDPIVPKVHVTCRPWRRGEDDVVAHNVALGEIGSDFIEVNGVIIDRSQILDIQPINF